MAGKALLFDGSRCSACQACVVACKQYFGMDMASGTEKERALASTFGQAIVPDDEAPLTVSLTEREAGQLGLVWEAHRLGCVHCVEAPCAEVCPTGALAVNGETGFVGLDGSRCVGCHLCTMVCPADAPRHVGDRAGVSLCDGCSGTVADGGVPACAAACPLDALVFDDRDALVSRANERVSALQERGYSQAAVLGVSEQGGHHVLQVLKYGVAGGPHEALANTGEVEWLDAARMAGPVSVGVLGLAAVGGLVGLAAESRRVRKAEAEAAALAQEAAAAAINPLWSEDMLAEMDESASVVGESALEAAVRRREALRMKKGSTPVAAAAAAAAAVPTEEYHWYEGGLAEENAPELRLVSYGREGFGMKDYSAFRLAWGAGVFGSGGFGGFDSGAFETYDYDAPDEEEGSEEGSEEVLGKASDEALSVDEASDTGELYDADEFNRLLAEDAARIEADDAGASENESKEDSSDETDSDEAHAE